MESSQAAGTVVYLSLGSNLGDREQTIVSAIDLLSQRVGPLLRRSDYYYSAPVGFSSDNEFCNICAAFLTNLSPMDLLHKTQAIERELGRKTKSIDGVYHDRTIDIDIILWQGLEMNTPQLTIPHPRYKNRDFVTVPLKEIQQ